MDCNMLYRLRSTSVFYVFLGALLVFFAITIRYGGHYNYELKMLEPSQSLSQTSDSHTVAAADENPKVTVVEAPPKPPGQKIVIVLAYMHSGSTYTASIIRNRPRTYYEFEAARYLQSSGRSKTPLIFLDGEIRDSMGMDIDPLVASDYVYKIGTCQHRLLDVGTLSNYYFGIVSMEHKDQHAYMRCLSKDNLRVSKPHSPSLPYNSVSVDTVKRCLPILEASCNSSRIRITKYIRLGLDAIYPILSEPDDIKIIYLVRDPRSMIDSQLRKNDMNIRSINIFHQRTGEMCTRLKQDLELADKIKAEFPGKLRTIRYEDLADYPMETAREIIEFIGEEFTQKDQEYVRLKSIDTGHKNNSTDRQATWRKHLDTIHLKGIDMHCGSLYDQLGYVKLNSQSEVRDMSKIDHIAKQMN